MQDQVILLVGLMLIALLAIGTLSDDYQQIRAYLVKMEKTMTDKIDELKDALAAYFVDLDKYVEDIKGASVAELEAARTKAVADDDAEEAMRIDAIIANVKARHDAIVKPTPPPIEPSNL